MLSFFFISIIQSAIEPFIRLILQSCTHSTIHSVIQSFIHSVSLSFTRSFFHSFIHPFIHSFIHASIHSFIHSDSQSVTHTFFTRSFIHLFVHSFINSSIHSFNDSVIHSIIHVLFFHFFFVRSFVRSFIFSFLHSVLHSVFHSFIHAFIHSFIPFFQKVMPQGPHYHVSGNTAKRKMRRVCVWIVLHVLQYLTPWYDRPMLLKCCLFFRKGRCGELERGMDRYGSSFRLIYCYQSFLFIVFPFLFSFSSLGGGRKKLIPSQTPQNELSIRTGTTVPAARTALRYRPDGI